MQSDFWTLSPETAHQVAWLFGDRGIPRTWRHMNGYGSHTYSWINAAGRSSGSSTAGRDADYHQRDLVNAIRRGEYPNWTLKVQIMPFEEANTYRYYPFDLTKVWPHA